MRITERQLRRIVRQEILRENPNAAGGAKVPATDKLLIKLDNPALGSLVGSQDTVPELEKLIRSILQKADDMSKGNVTKSEVMTVLRNLLGDSELMKSFDAKPEQKAESLIRRRSRRA